MRLIKSQSLIFNPFEHKSKFKCHTTNKYDSKK